MKSTQVIDLSWNRKKEMRWLDGHDIDAKLLFECAYYPKQPAFGIRVSGCVKCSFEKPKKSCPYSHILTLTEANPKTKVSRELSRALEIMNEEDREAVEQFLRERRK